MFPELLAMNASLEAFNKGIAPYFSVPSKSPDLITPHDFEHTIKSIDVIVHYETKCDRLDCVDEIDYGSIRIYHAGVDVSDWFPDSRITGNLRHMVEADWERICQENKDDFK